MCFHCVPIFDDAVADGRVGVVVGSRDAGLHKQYCVGDGDGCFNLHEHHLLEVHLHWVAAGIDWVYEQLAVVEFKLVGESTKAFLCEGVWVFVSVSQGQVGLPLIGT